MPLPTREVREALLILFEGRPRVAIEILETLSQELGDSHVQVPAFLGAAYCHIAFLNPGADSSVLEKAREQFRVVLKVQPHYQLPETLFSPRVRAMLDSLR